MNFKKHLFLFAGILSCSFIMAQQPSDILSVSASTKLEKASLAFDKDPKTMWEVNGQDLKADQCRRITSKNALHLFCKCCKEGRLRTNFSNLHRNS